MAQMAPPRAGTFIYHTHIDDVKQLSSGLYGPLIVLPPGEKFDPETDRVLLISRAGPGADPDLAQRQPVSGDRQVQSREKIQDANHQHRAGAPIDIDLKVAGMAATWRPIAKDGADLPLAQRKLCPAQLTISVGETYDFEFRPERAGELTLEVVRPSNKFPAQITPSHKVVELRPESRVAVKVVVQE